MKYGYIYKISYKDLNYYGSSKYKNRFIGHKSDYKSWKEGKADLYVSSFKLFEEAEKNNEQPTFEVLGCFYKPFCNECMRKEEQKYIDGNECVNIQNAFVSEEQRKENMREYMIEYMKEYREENKEQIAEYNKQYNEENKERIKEYFSEHYEKNKERKKEYQKQYDEKNKERKKEYMREYHLKKRQLIHTLTD